MKTKYFAFTVALGSAVSLSAIERPKGDDTQVPEEPRGGILDPHPARETEPGEPRKAEAPEKIAYLGVSGEPIGEALKLHLELKKGLILATVDPTSPAGLSGLMEHDILLAVDETELTDQTSLRAAILTHQPGDLVNLKLVRRGKKIEQELALGAAPADRSVPPMALLPDRATEMNKLLGPGFGLKLGGLDSSDIEKEMMDRLRQALGGGAPDALGQGRPQLRFQIPGDDQQPNGAFRSFGSVSLQDEEGSVQMKTKGGKSTVVVRDRAGKVLYEGPFNTEEDKEAVPEELRERVERLDTGNGRSGFHFEFKGLGAPQPGRQNNEDGE